MNKILGHTLSRENIAIGDTVEVSIDPMSGLIELARVNQRKTDLQVHLEIFKGPEKKEPDLTYLARDLQGLLSYAIRLKRGEEAQEQLKTELLRIYNLI